MTDPRSRVAHRLHAGPTLPSWPALMVIGGTALYALAPGEDTLPWSIPALVVFGAAMYVFPRCRPVPGRILSPLTWSLFLFALPVVVGPLLIAYFGPTQAVLPTLPSTDAMNLALVLSTVAFIAFCAGFSLSHGGFERRSIARSSSGWFRAPLPNWLCFLFVCLGVIGLMLSFGSPQGVLASFSTPVAAGESGESATVVSLLGNVLRPFLGFGLIAAWCRWVDGPSRSPSSARLWSIALVLGFIVSYGTFGLNRASLAYPLISVLAVYSIRIQTSTSQESRRCRDRDSILLSVVGAYRSMRLNPASTDTSATPSIGQLDLNAEIQVYGAAPQYLAFVMVQAHEDPTRKGGALVAGVLSPIPVLGEPYRLVSGTGVYNEWLYGRTDFRDQVIPFAGELYIDFRLPGVVFGFLLLGVALARLQVGVTHAKSALGLYVAQYIGMWTAFLIIGSAEVLSQIFVYFMWPVYASIVYEWIRGPGHTSPVHNIGARGPLPA